MDIITFVQNIGAALIMGLAIGLEREYRQHGAGLRTNALVCVGAALFVSLSIMLEKDSSPTRIAGQVVSGIGFLGGGVILREGFSVRGLATAATLWCSAAVGTLAGTGMILQGFVGTAVVLSIHLTLRPLVQRIELHTKTSVEIETKYRMRVNCSASEAALIRAIFMRHVNSQAHMIIQGVATEETQQADKKTVVVEICSSERKDKYMEELVSRIGVESCVSAVSWERVQ